MIILTSHCHVLPTRKGGLKQASLQIETQTVDGRAPEGTSATRARSTALLRSLVPSVPRRNMQQRPAASAATGTSAGFG